MGVNREWCQKIIRIGVLVIIVFHARAKKRFKIRKCIWGSLKKTLVQGVRILNNREEKTTFTIVDAQSVKNTDTAKNKGYDAGKKVSGIKRHIAVDSNGLPMLCMLLYSWYNWQKLCSVEMLKKYNDNLSQVQNILVDSRY